MTGKSLREYFETHVDDSMDVTALYQLFSMIKNQIERDIKPAFLVEVDSSKSRVSGEIYTTMKDLPANFRVMKTLYVGTREYKPIPFARRITYKDSAYKYYIDHKNSQFGICGTAGAGETIYQYVIKKTTDFTESNEDSEILTWPAEFHLLIPIIAGKIFRGNIDADSISQSMALSDDILAKSLWMTFLSYCADLEVDAMNNTCGYDEENVPFDLGLL